MKEEQPTQKEWRALYDVAVRVKELAPWEWMFEDETFGVQDPESGETGFVSVMGAGGEHYAIAFYPDPKAHYEFLALHDEAAEEDEEDSDGMATAMRVLEIPQLQASFEDNKQLSKEDKAVIKQLGLKFRGANAWPQFRSYAPGLFPWFLTGTEVRRLTHALAQLLDVAPRCRENEDLLAPSEDGTDFLVRVSREEDGKLVWEDQIKTFPLPEPEQIPIVLDQDALNAAKALPLVEREVELELMMMPMPVAEKKNERPSFPYLLMIADGQSGMLIGTDMLQALPSLTAMYGQVPGELLDAFLRVRGVSSYVRVRSELLADLLEPLAEELGFRVRVTGEMPAIDSAMEFMGQMLPNF
jgi:hypothetical protein